MKVYSHSEQGKRAYQQDRFLVKGSLFVVCDGMGGHANGELAAEAGVKRLNDIVFDGNKSPCDLMSDAIKLANDDCKNSGDNRGSTVTAVHIDEEAKMLSISHVGDSRAYLIRADNSIDRLTTDHVGFMGGITSCIGFLRDIEVSAYPYKNGDRILIVSDGVYGAYAKRNRERPFDIDENSYLMVKEIARAHNELKVNPAEHLCHDAIARGSTDNCTAVLVEL